MKEFIDKLIERLEEKKSEAVASNVIWAYSKVIRIVNELAEEYNNGWIRVEDRLPELTEGTECFKQSKCCLVALKWWDGDITESVAWYNQSGVWNEDSKNCKVIAWMPLPAPFKEGE